MTTHAFLPQSTAAFSLGPPELVVFERGPSRWAWLALSVVVAAALGICVACFPPTTAGRILGTAGCLLVAAVFGTHAVRSFRERDDAHTFFGNRLEVHRRGQLLHRLPYASVERVAYGFRPDNADSQFLSFSGPGKEPYVYLSVSGSEPPGTNQLDGEKLRALRDLLYEVVAARMMEQAATPDGAAWLRNLRLTARGPLAGTRLVPWPQVRILDDHSTGNLSLADATGAELGKGFMTEDNIIPGLIAARRLQEAATSV